MPTGLLNGRRHFAGFGLAAAPSVSAVLSDAFDELVSRAKSMRTTLACRAEG
jgi:hypothetical protein